MRKQELDYYKAVDYSLKTINKIIVENSKKDLKSFNLTNYEGRNGSAAFEDDFLKPLIRSNLSRYHNIINSGLGEQNNSYRFHDILADDSLNEADKRSMADVILLLKTPNNKIIEVAVNVKATKIKSSADNVGGWQALGVALYGYNIGQKIRTENALMNTLASDDIEINNSLSDYFLWTFYKDYSNSKGDSSVELTLLNSKVHSFFGSSLDGFKINMKQSFPYQFNSKHSMEIDESRTSYMRRKLSFVNKMLVKRREYNLARIVQDEEISNKMSEYYLED